MCPALGHLICAVCCGTKRLVEIECPSDCGYLSAARSHPPAVVQRRRERDTLFLASLVRDLTRPQYDLFLVTLSTLRQQRAAAPQRILDSDVAEACGALAATQETSDRGIIYEHQATSLPAQRLAHELSTVFKDLETKLGRSLESDTAKALRGIERGAKGASEAAGDGDTAFLDWLDRMLREAEQRAGASPATPEGPVSPSDDEAPRLIVP